MEGVPHGKYRMQWRMRLSLSARWNEPLEFKAFIIPVSPLYCYNNVKNGRKKLNDYSQLLFIYTEKKSSIIIVTFE